LQGAPWYLESTFDETKTRARAVFARLMRRDLMRRDLMRRDFSWVQNFNVRSLGPAAGVTSSRWAKGSGALRFVIAM
jgi:hypothetical protein